METPEKPEQVEERSEPQSTSLTWGPPLLAFGAVFLASAGAMVLVDAPRPPAVQPVVFSHQKHVGELELECEQCHVHFREQAFSGLPTAEVCAECHLEAEGESPEELKLVKLLQEGKPLQWTSLFRQPAHVYFSHRRHASVAGIECQTCHGAFAETSAPPQRVRILSMDDCIDCHREQQVSEHCTACHR